MVFEIKFEPGFCDEPSAQTQGRDSVFSVAALGRHEVCKLEAPRAVMSLSFTLNLFDLAPAFQLALAGLNLAQGDSRRAGWMPGTAAGRGQEIDGQDIRQEDGRHDRHDGKCAADGDFSLRSDRQIDTNTNHLTRTQVRAHTRPIIRILSLCALLNSPCITSVPRAGKEGVPVAYRKEVLLHVICQPRRLTLRFAFLATH